MKSRWLSGIGLAVALAASGGALTACGSPEAKFASVKAGPMPSGEVWSGVYYNPVYGYLNICPHYSSALNYRAGQFLSEDKSHIRCTMHYAEFRIEDGYGVKGAAERCYLDPVPVRVENDMIVIAPLDDPS